MQSEECPLIIYDGECEFCCIWVEFAKRLTGDRVAYLPSQEARKQYPQISESDFERSVQFIENGRVYDGAEAVFRALGYAPGYGWLQWLYVNLPGFAPVSELGYRFIADHRNLFYWVTRLVWGTRLEPTTYPLVRAVFARGLGLVYFVAFVSFGSQITGLIGSNGLLPIGVFLAAQREFFGAAAYYNAPTLFWLNSSDLALEILPIVGALLAFLLMVGFTRRIIFVALFVLYLSMVTAGQDFMGFQWDSLLLEAGLLAIFLDTPSNLIVWLYRWLLFRLMFLSGYAKIASGDETWRNLTALDYHFWTQPIPNVIAYYVAQLPETILRGMTIGMFVIEVAVPFFIFAPRRLRAVAGILLIGFQLLLAATGNFAFFNLLALALCLFCFDDQFLRRIIPTRWADKISARYLQVKSSTVGLLAVRLLAILVLLVSGMQLLGVMTRHMPDEGAALLDLVAPFRIVNTYGLFAVMTTERPEIIIEGSNDGETWLPYEFPFKAGDVNQAPPFVAPLQPRLDWQLWFAALGARTGDPALLPRILPINASLAFQIASFNSDPWFAVLMVRLLQGSPQVLGLLKKNPFPDAPPRYVRAQMYRYRFADLALHDATGAWWTRELEEPYFPVVSLQ